MKRQAGGRASLYPGSAGTLAPVVTDWARERISGGRTVLYKPGRWRGELCRAGIQSGWKV